MDNKRSYEAKPIGNYRKLKPVYRTLLRVGLIVCGVILLLVPTIKDTYQQKQLIAEWQRTLNVIDVGILEEREIDLEEDVSVETQAQRIREQDELKAKQVAQARQAYIKANMQGVLAIPKITLNLPILLGASVENLKLSVASLEKTSRLGEIGNLAIAGHRMRAYGKIFNRLDELEPGDVMSIDDGSLVYQFVVTEKLLVLPEEVEVLKGNGIDEEITLITCHPVYNPTHRLIIKGKRMVA